MAEDGQISSAIIAVFAWYVPHVGMDVVENLKMSSTVTIVGSSHRKASSAAVRTAVILHRLLAVAVGLAVIAGTAVGVAMSTQGLDDRMETILVGMSRIMAALLLCFVSYKFPKWCGLYPSLRSDARRRRRSSQATDSSIASSSSRPISLRVLAFNVRWSIWRHLGKQYFVLMPFFCGVQPMTIPVSMIIGSAGGALILLLVYLGTLFFRRRQSLLVPVVIAVGLAALSSVAFSAGCYYIGDAWGGTSASIFGSAKVLAYVSFAVWFLALMLVHSVLLKCNAGRAVIASASAPQSKHDASTSSPATSTSSNIVASSVVSAASVPAEKVSVPDETERTASDSESDDEEGVETVFEEPAPVTVNNNDAATAFDERSSERSSQRMETDEKEPTWCELVRGKLCCCSSSYDHRPPPSCCGRIASAFKWILWVALSAFCLFVTVVNIGSTSQQHSTSESLATVQSTLYGGMSQGPVCAFNNQGYNSTMRTFKTVEAANAKGFLVVHCGACAACSSWRNLKALWQSRQDVAERSRQCGRRTVVPGGRDAAIQCHADTIGFDEECGACYVNDDICTRGHCEFMVLQSELIDHMASLPPDPSEPDVDQCSDAMCSANFLPCAGASLRRMDVGLKSSESIPRNQQCRVVQVDWNELFSDEFYVH